MYDKIVIPLDGSPLAETALPYAEEIAAKTSSDIILLSVLQSEEAQEYQKHHSYAVKVVEATKRRVEKYLENSPGEAINVDTVTRAGNPAEGILDYVNKGAFNLIVMATHGRSGISRWAIGSVADKVVRATIRQPLMLIRTKGSHPDIQQAERRLKKALVPLDGSTGSEAVIPHIVNLQMEPTLLQVITKNNHVSADPEAYLQHWCSRLEEKGVSSRYEVRTGTPADEIIDLADELAMDMVAMSTHGRNAIGLWPLGSVAQKVMLGGNLPLLLVRA